MKNAMAFDLVNIY